MCPSTPADRAAAAFDTGSPAARRGAVLTTLFPYLYRVAGRLTGRDGHLADDLVAHLLLQCERGLYDPARQSFPGWARRVMTNRLVTHARRGRAFAPALPADVADPRNRLPEVDGRDLLTAPFAPLDLATVRSWTLGQRVVLLVRGLMWAKIPAADQAATHAATRLPTDFPGPDYADLAPSDRHAALAVALRLPVNTLHQKWLRWRPRLDALHFVRALRSPD